MDAATCRVVPSSILGYKDTCLSRSLLLLFSSYRFDFHTNHFRLARSISLPSLPESRFIATISYYERPYPWKSQGDAQAAQGVYEEGVRSVGRTWFGFTRTMHSWHARGAAA